MEVCGKVSVGCLRCWNDGCVVGDEWGKGLCCVGECSC